MRNLTVSQGRSWLKLFKLYEYFIPIVNGQGLLLQRADNAAVSWIRNLMKPTVHTARWLDEFDTTHITILKFIDRKSSIKVAAMKKIMTRHQII